MSAQGAAEATAKKIDADIESAVSVTKAELTGLLRGYLSQDGEAEARARKKVLSASFNHLGIRKILKLEDDDQPAKLVAYTPIGSPMPTR